MTPNHLPGWGSGPARTQSTIGETSSRRLSNIIAMQRATRGNLLAVSGPALDNQRYVTPSRRHHWKRIRRPERGSSAQTGRCRRHPDLKDDDTPVPAVAVSGGDGNPVRGRCRPHHQADPAQAEERPGVVGRGRRDRYGGENGHVAPDGHGDGDALRQPHRGRRRAAVLLRQRRLRRLRARHEEHRRRPRAAGAHPRRV